MKIAVIGAGIVGITSAHALAQDGHQVVVFERNAAIAEEASFAHAGLLAPSLFPPLSHSRWPDGSWLRHFQKDAALTIRKGAGPRELRWLMGWRRQLPADAFAARFRQIQQLAQYGVDCLHQVSLDAGLEMEQEQGQLVLFESEADLAEVQPKLDLLKDIGIPMQLMDRSQAQKVEPALDANGPMHAAVHFPQDEVANCRQFAHLLKDRALALGVQFRFGRTLAALRPGTPLQLEFAEQQPAESFDHVVLCTGAGNRAIAGMGNGKLPLVELHSYSVSLPIRETLNAPRSAVLDHRRAISIGRMGARIRVSGGTELGADPGKIHAATTKQLFGHLETCFPGAASYQGGSQIWKGRSAFSPDALPLVGPTATPGVWLNLGHGHNGWAMCCGTAQMVADMLGGRASAIDSSGLQPARFQI